MIQRRLPKNTENEAKRKERKPGQRPPRDFGSFVKFLAVSLILLVVVHFVFLRGEAPHIKKMKEEYYAEKAAKEKQLEQVIEELLPPEVEFPPTLVTPDNGKEYFEAPPVVTSVSKPLAKNLPPIPSALKPIPPKKDNALSAPLPKRVKHEGRPKIAIVIDDVGMNLKQSRIAMSLPKQVTLAFLPYAEKVKPLTEKAKKTGHELIIHTPMEAMNADVPLGGMALKVGMKPDDLAREFNRIAESFEGYVGINNHMGSRLTQDPQAMVTLMILLKRRGLYFLDSKTINSSIAAQAANKVGIPYAVRDVFLDHESTPEFVSKALQDVERIASSHGSAIAIGHPKEVTMQALKKWLPTLKKKGFDLVPLSALLTHPKKMEEVKPETEIKKVSVPFSPAPETLHFQLPE